MASCDMILGRNMELLMLSQYTSIKNNKHGALLPCQLYFDYLVDVKVRCVYLHTSMIGYIFFKLGACCLVKVNL